MKRPAILPNIVTAFSLSCGLFVIFKMSMIAPGAATYDSVLIGVAILILAAFLDLLDGAIARAMKVESEFGGFFDSLSDAVTFGVAPAVLVLKALSVEPKTLMSFFLMTSAVVYSISGVLRLVRFTVSKQKIEPDSEEMKKANANFTGLPIPAGAMLTVSTTLFLMSSDGQSLLPTTPLERAVIATIVFFVVGYFMISRWKFPSLKTLHIRVGSFQVVLLTAFVTAAILIGVAHHFALFLAAATWAYLLVSWTLSIIRVISGRRLKVLEDFEPEPENNEED
jgi:CDP-diacylglycerol--serine O-phosphatidyltransferase